MRPVSLFVREVAYHQSGLYLSYQPYQATTGDVGHGIEPGFHAFCFERGIKAVEAVAGK